MFMFCVKLKIKNMCEIKYCKLNLKCIIMVVHGYITGDRVGSKKNNRNTLNIEENPGHPELH